MLPHLRNALDGVAEIAGKRTLVVSGNPKSGTTWVQRLLDAHPEIYCAGEGKFAPLLEDFLEAVRGYDIALEHTNRVIYADGAFYRPWGAGEVAAAFQFFMALSWARSNHGSLAAVKYVGDKDTQYLPRIEFWRDHLLPDARFVHVVRDGRDCAVSQLLHERRTGREAPATPAAFHDYVAAYAKKWVNAITTFRAAFADEPARYHEIRYEDLLAEPKPAVTALLRFLDVADDEAVVAGMLAAAAFERVSGGRESGEEDRESFYRKGVAGDWRNHFDARAREIFAANAGEVLARLGYDAR